MSNVVGNMRKTIQDYGMIEDNDRIAVGLSGGKDSMALVYALSQFQRFSPIAFYLEAITVDMGFDNFNLEAAQQFCNTLNVPYTIVKTEISKIVFDIRDEKNPCSLCANMRRGVLAQTMNERNLKKLALGHHQDDALTTLFMNMMYAGKLNTLEYISYLSRTEVHVIRPFLNVPECDIKGFINKHQIPVLKSPCPMDKKTSRESVSAWVKTIQDNFPHSRKSLVSAMRNEEQCNLFKNKKVPL